MEWYGEKWLINAIAGAFASARVCARAVHITAHIRFTHLYFDKQSDRIYPQKPCACCLRVVLNAKCHLILYSRGTAFEMIQRILLKKHEFVR